MASDFTINTDNISNGSDLTIGITPQPVSAEGRRVINYHTRHSCCNDMRVDFDHFDFLWCQRHKRSDRHFECTKLISADQAITSKDPGISET